MRHASGIAARMLGRAARGKRAAGSLRQILSGLACALLLGGPVSAATLRAPEREAAHSAVVFSVASQQEMRFAGPSLREPVTSLELAAPLRGGWSLRGALDVDRSGTLAPAFGIARANLLGRDDWLSFTVSRPERETQFAAIWILGIDPERSRSDLLLRQSEQLVRSAREFAMRGAYRAKMGAWVGGLTVGYSFNAGQVAGRDAIRTTLSLTRSF
jgi:hypothetical protein